VLGPPQPGTRGEEKRKKRKKRKKYRISLYCQLKEGDKVRKAKEI